MDVAEFQRQIGLHFNQPDLLAQALTHRSFLNEQADDTLRDNERLEFLGDSILDFVITNMLFRRYPGMQEGELTRLRAALVRTEMLAELAAACHVGEALRMGKGEDNSGGRRRRTILCDAFEALLGALFLDQGLAAVENFVLPLLVPRADYILAEGLHRDARSTLQEWSQATHNLTPVYRVIESAGPDHDRAFTVEVTIGDQAVGRGTGKSKQLAAQAAARVVLHQIEAGEAPAIDASPASKL
jgi:ribonuclease-3